MGFLLDQDIASQLSPSYSKLPLSTLSLVLRIKRSSRDRSVTPWYNPSSPHTTTAVYLLPDIKAAGFES